MIIKQVPRPRTLGVVAGSLALVLCATATAQASVSRQHPSGLTVAAARLAARAGFTAEDSATQLTPTASISSIEVTPLLSVDLGTVSGSAYRDGQATINPSANGSATVVEPGAFGIVTTRHGVLEYAYKVTTAPGTSLVPASDGGLNQADKAGHVLWHIDAAYAIDSTGAQLPASYSYDAATHQLLVKADTTKAHGAVFIDPSWKCWATASAVGLVWLVAAFGWIFTDGGETWVIWALRAWFGISLGAADRIARACTGT